MYASVVGGFDEIRCVNWAPPPVDESTERRSVEESFGGPDEEALEGRLLALAEELEQTNRALEETRSRLDAQRSSGDVSPEGSLAVSRDPLTEEGDWARLSADHEAATLSSWDEQNLRGRDSMNAVQQELHEQRNRIDELERVLGTLQHPELGSKVPRTSDVSFSGEGFQGKMNPKLDSQFELPASSPCAAGTRTQVACRSANNRPLMNPCQVVGHGVKTPITRNPGGSINPLASPRTQGMPNMSPLEPWDTPSRPSTSPKTSPRDRTWELVEPTPGMRHMPCSAWGGGDAAAGGEAPSSLAWRLGLQTSAAPLLASGAGSPFPSRHTLPARKSSPVPDTARAQVVNSANAFRAPQALSFGARPERSISPLPMQATMPRAPASSPSASNRPFVLTPRAIVPAATPRKLLQPRLKDGVSSVPTRTAGTPSAPAGPPLSWLQPGVPVPQAPSTPRGLSVSIPVAAGLHGISLDPPSLDVPPASNAQFVSARWPA